MARADALGVEDASASTTSFLLSVIDEGTKSFMLGSTRARGGPFPWIFPGTSMDIPWIVVGISVDFPWIDFLALSFSRTASTLAALASKTDTVSAMIDKTSFMASAGRFSARRRLMASEFIRSHVRLGPTQETRRTLDEQ